jgi:hypothetical protein
VSRATLWDELWLGVKCQSNQVIAGSPRNSFRASVIFGIGGRALNGGRWRKPTFSNQTPNTDFPKDSSQTMGAKPH